jgi:hypothetical protein
MSLSVITALMRNLITEPAAVLRSRLTKDTGAQEFAAVEVVDGGGLPGGMRGSLISGPMRSMPVVVPFEVGEDLPGVSLVHEQEVVEGLAAHSADHPLAVRVHSRRP